MATESTPNLGGAARAAAIATAAGAAAGAATAGVLHSRRAAIATRREFRLQAGEEVAGGLRRVVIGQLEGAAAGLEQARPGERGEAVHDARKSLKRLRAILRLLREPLGEERYSAENATLRDTARALADARDAEVMLDTLESLLAERTELDEVPAVRALHERLRADAERERARLEDGDAHSVIARLEYERRGAHEWQLADGGFDSVSAGLERLYRRGRREHRDARRDPEAEALHEWRKSVKYLRHAAEVLEPLRPKRLAEVAARARRLGDVLGDDHDLAVLRDLALAGADEGQLAPLLEAIDARRAALVQEALALGAKLYKHRPGRFVRAAQRGWAEHSDGRVLLIS
jgi:CHAD domain-containing protein